MRCICSMAFLLLHGIRFVVTELYDAAEIARIPVLPAAASQVQMGGRRSTRRSRTRRPSTASRASLTSRSNVASLVVAVLDCYGSRVGGVIDHFGVREWQTGHNAKLRACSENCLEVIFEHETRLRAT